MLKFYSNGKILVSSKLLNYRETACYVNTLMAVRRCWHKSARLRDHAVSVQHLMSPGAWENLIVAEIWLENAMHFEFVGAPISKRSTQQRLVIASIPKSFCGQQNRLLRDWEHCPSVSTLKWRRCYSRLTVLLVALSSESSGVCWLSTFWHNSMTRWEMIQLIVSRRKWLGWSRPMMLPRLREKPGTTC